MPENKGGRIPTKRKGEAPEREAADVEREASAGDAASAPPDEGQSERVRPARRDDDTDEEME